MHKNFLKPLLKWAGGKRWLCNGLHSIYSVYSTRLVEPFCGGLSVALRINPEKALLSDANVPLINFYNQVSKQLLENFNFENERDYFQVSRERFNLILKLSWQTDDRLKLELAQLFYYLNKTCFNGLCRFNSKGEFNVPFGRYKKINYHQDFESYRNVFNNWKFINCDFSELEINKNDFIYCDPPYDTDFSRYSKNDFTWEDQQRLVAWLRTYDNPILISNQATDRIVELYSTFGLEMIFLKAPRMISANGSRQPAREVLAYRNIDKKVIEESLREYEWV